jgi:hypothetical protein
MAWIGAPGIDLKKLSHNKANTEPTVKRHEIIDNLQVPLPFNGG